MRLDHVGTHAICPHTAALYMSSTFTVKPGSWVRVKRGLYADDLAQVTKMSTNDMRPRITCKLIPRIDLSREHEEKCVAWVKAWQPAHGGAMVFRPTVRFSQS